MKTCAMCGLEKQEVQFRPQKGRKTLRSNCRSCDTKRHKEWRQKNLEHLRAYNKSRWVNSDRWESHINKKFGITAGIYRGMLKNQKGVCAICGAKEPGGRSKRFHIDHCHTSGQVRGLLCVKCNQMLGHARDDSEVLRRAITYLKSTPRKRKVL